MKKILLLLLLCNSLFTQDIVLSTRRIVFEDFPGAHNPSIIKYDQGYIMTFRYIPDIHTQPWASYIGIVMLDEKFEPIGDPQLVSTRSYASKTQSQSEDARIFTWRGRLFVIYNDNLENIYPETWQRRDMYLAELLYSDNKFSLSSSMKLYHENKYPTVMWQKNWVPFEWNNQLLMTYSINPHEIIFLNWLSGACYPCYETSAQIDWKHGTLRGSTPPLIVDGEYLAFFHSSTYNVSPVSDGRNMYHYYMGVYTFSAQPPFAMTKISPEPIVGDGFYTRSSFYKRVIFPGGYVVVGPKIYVVYGKDDCELWIATLDKEALMKSLVAVKKN